MKIAFYCESPADQTALAVITEGILGQALDPIYLEARSVPAFFIALDGVFRGVHWDSDADAFIPVVDSDRTELHDSATRLRRKNAVGSVKPSRSSTEPRRS